MRYDRDTYEQELAEARLDLSIVKFDPKAHPRDFMGRFREVLGGMETDDKLDVPGLPTIYKKSKWDKDLNKVDVYYDSNGDEVDPEELVGKIAKGESVDTKAAPEISDELQTEIDTEIDRIVEFMDEGSGSAVWPSGDEVHVSRGPDGFTIEHRKPNGDVEDLFPNANGELDDIYDLMYEIANNTAAAPMDLSGDSAADLNLTVFANAIKSRYPSKKKGQGTAVAEAEAQAEYKGTDATGDGTFEEGKHKRGVDGKFITKGASGPEVRAVGDALGMTNLPNEFDDKMEERVREFQQRNGLLVDGLVGRQTAAAMLEQEDADTAKPGEITDRQMKRLVKQMRRSNVQKRG